MKEESGNVCHDKVKLLLKAPDTAKFDSTVTSEKDLHHYSVRGLVSAENGFGALIQGGYNCKVHFTRTLADGNDDFFITPRLTHR